VTRAIQLKEARASSYEITMRSISPFLRAPLPFDTPVPIFGMREKWSAKLEFQLFFRTMKERKKERISTSPPPLGA